ncbi:MAG TPA: lipid II flippase MurJ [Candidatus Angelobacter sp.]
MIFSRALQAVGLKPVSPDRPLTTNWKIFRAIVVVGFCTALAKLAATAKELAVADWFGRGDALDAFLIAMLLPTTVVSLLAGAFSGSVIPSFIRIREEKGQDAAQQLFSSIQIVGLVLLLVVSILLAVVAPFYLPLLGSGFSAAKLLLTRQLLYALLPFVVLNGAIAIWSSVLNAGERFALPALTPTVTPLVAVVTLLLCGRTWGIFALAAGTVAGTVLEASLLGRAVRVHGFSLKFRWYGFSPELRMVMWQYLPMVLATLVTGISPIIDQSMAAMLKGGSVAALNYGNKIINVVTSLSSAALYSAVLPYFSQMVARKDWSSCRRTLKVYSFLVLAATIPMTAILILVSRPLVQLLYQRGAFTPADTAVVSEVQVFFSLMIPAYTWAVLFVRLISSLHRNDVLVYATIMSATLNVVLNIVCMRRWGVAGIALSTSLVYTISCTFLAFSALRLLHREESAGRVS